MSVSSQAQELQLEPHREHLTIAFQALWVIFTLGAVVVLAIGIPARYGQLVGILRDLSPFGLSASHLSLYAIGFELVYALAFLGVAIFLFHKRHSDRRVIFFSIVLTAVGINQTYIAGVSQVKLLVAVAAALAVVFLYVFPDGRFVPHWTRIPALVWIGLSILWFLFPPMPFNIVHTHTTMAVPLMFFLLPGSFMALGLWSQLERYRRAVYTERQQIKWLLFGLCFLAAGAAVQFSPVLNVPDTSPAGVLIRSPIAATLAIVWPLSILFAIMSFRLWDIDWIIDRALVYTLLVILLVAIYVLLISMWTALFRLINLVDSQFLVSLIATGMVTVLFQPLRARIQHLVSRLVFGERADPYTVLARLGQRLENSLTPDVVLPTIEATVKEALRLPYVAIKLALNDEQPPATEDSTLPQPSHRLPLICQNEIVGYLLFAPRSAEETLSAGELRLLQDLARQAGLAIHSMRLLGALQRVREKERRRLRRDLHEGLGSRLAAQVLKARTIRTSLQRGDVMGTDQYLVELEHSLQAITAEVRRIIEDIRPSALDDLGLVEAIRDHASQLETPSLAIGIEIPEALPPLPSAIEEAVYQIAREALTNVAKHAQAHTCTVRIVVDGTALKLEVSDDGCGLAMQSRGGIGLRSMRERAEELSGRCIIESAPGQGTIVTAYLPLASAAYLVNQTP